MTSTYSIKDLEQLSGIKAHTIRAWEQRFKLIQPKRTDTNIRFYNDIDLRVVLNTSVLISNGMKISQISKLAPEQIAKEALDASPYLGDYQYELNELKISTLNFDVARFEAVMATCIELYGVHATFQEVIGDFIQELGKLWLSGCVGISQEHFMSSLLRQKLEMFLMRESLTQDISMARFANVAFSDGSLLHGFNQRFAKKQPLSAQMMFAAIL